MMAAVATVAVVAATAAVVKEPRVQQVKYARHAKAAAVVKVDKKLVLRAALKAGMVRAALLAASAQNAANVPSALLVTAPLARVAVVSALVKAEVTTVKKAETRAVKMFRPN